jgi:hypothetical protein
MAAKKQPVKQEPFLNTVARKLGQAAGTLTKVTQEVTENLSTFPESVETKMRDAVNSGTPGKRSQVRTRHPKKSTRQAAGGPKAKGTATVEKGRSPKKKSPRSKRKPINVKA